MLWSTARRHSSAVTPARVRIGLRPSPLTTTTFAYDRTAQLISRTDPGGTTTFGYDAYGNQTSNARAPKGRYRKRCLPPPR
jgi:YD repeat-containing protein